MSSRGMTVIRAAVVALIILAGRTAHAEYLRIQLKVYGLDCEMCARGVSKSVGRLSGVESVNVSLKTGTLEIVLKRGNTLTMRDFRKRIKENGFRSMGANVTAIGSYDGSKFHVLGSDDAYQISRPAANESGATEVTFDLP